MTTTRIIIPVYKYSDNIKNSVNSILEFAKNTNSEFFIINNNLQENILEYSKLLNVKIISRNEKQSAAYARNCGAEDFNTGILIFIDSDVICEPDCLYNLIKPIAEGQCDATVGNYSKNVYGLNFFQKYKQLYIHYIYSKHKGFLKNDFWTAISAIKAEVFHKLNGFNTNFKNANGEDREFGIRLSKFNYKILRIQKAQGIHLHKFSFTGIIQNDLKKGIVAVTNSFNNKTPLSDDQHASLSNKISVMIAGTILLFLLSSFFFYQFLFVACSFFGVYIFSRFGLFSFFSKSQGVLFCLQTIGLMFVLDLVRLFCVFAGTSKYIWEKIKKVF